MAYYKQRYSIMQAENRCGAVGACITYYMTNKKHDAYEFYNNIKTRTAEAGRNFRGTIETYLVDNMAARGCDNCVLMYACYDVQNDELTEESE